MGCNALDFLLMKDGKAGERTRNVTVLAKDRLHLDYLDADADQKESASKAAK